MDDTERHVAMVLAAALTSREGPELTRTNIALLTASRACRDALAGDYRATDLFELALDAAAEPVQAVAQLVSLTIFALGALEALAEARGDTLDATLRRLGIITA